ncbi:MAG: mannose-1-phosphate guanylyltransferase [Kiritimatiellae bacterium]|nr:mannose-1-phosphate guanylyltransferase [Kiritimatiellia bacterium]
MKSTDRKSPLPRSPRLWAVIMAGGRGERFWPVGRAARPKQFVDLFGGKPLIAHAVERLRGLVPPERVLVVTSRALAAATRRALPSLPPSQILGEPCARDTAAACATATAWVRARAGDDAVLAILTADHLVADAAGFRRVLADAAAFAARRPVMALVGIRPTRPATGYGYVELGAPCAGAGLPRGFRKAKRFVEKPNLGAAATYVASGRFVWNSGMFVWRAGTFLAALAAHAPALAAAAGRLGAAFETGRPAAAARALDREYAHLEKISVDYAVMEKADNLVAARGDFGWDDVGAWPSAGDHLPRDAAGNAVSGRVETLAAKGCVIVNAQPGHLLAVMGAENLVAVHAADATLVCTREAAAGLKELVKKIAAASDGARYV